MGCPPAGPRQLQRLRGSRKWKRAPSCCSASRQCRCRPASPWPEADSGPRRAHTCTYNRTYDCLADMNVSTTNSDDHVLEMAISLEPGMEGASFHRAACVRHVRGILPVHSGLAGQADAKETTCPHMVKRPLHFWQTTEDCSCPPNRSVMGLSSAARYSAHRRSALAHSARAVSSGSLPFSRFGCSGGDCLSSAGFCGSAATPTVDPDAAHALRRARFCTALHEQHQLDDISRSYEWPCRDHDSNQSLQVALTHTHTR